MRISRSLGFHTKQLSKRLLTISILAIATIAGLSSLTLVLQPTKQASAITPPDSCFNFNSATGTITNYYNNENNDSSQPACPKDVDIPSTIGGVAVTAITGPNSWTGAFQNNQLTSVTIPNSVTSIGEGAFQVNQLTSVTIPDSVTSIGSLAFSFNQLTSVTIPNSVTSISAGAFSSNQLTSVTIPNSVTSIGDNAFSSNQLTSVTIPNSVTSIGDNAFSSNQLTSVTIPNSVISIGDRSFQINHLTAIVIPDSVISVGEAAFQINQLTSVTIPNSVASLGDYAFSQNQLTAVTIPSSVTSIGEGVFFGNRLTSVTIPNSVTSIDLFAFALQSRWGRDMEDGVNGAPDIYSSDPTEVQQAYDSLWYVRLYTTDPTNPNNLTDAVLFEATFGADQNNNGHMNDSLGGHLINPASLDLHYVNQTNTDLQNSQAFTGQLPDSTYLHNYYASQGPALPALADPWNPTPAEQQATQEALSAYYRLGDTVTITPPAIDGYITPPTKTFVLGAATNSENYVYTQASSGSSEQGGDGQLAETGMDIRWVVFGSLGVLITANAIYWTRHITSSRYFAL